jgi:hypothetical protein
LGKDWLWEDFKSYLFNCYPDHNQYEKNELIYNNLMFYPVSETLLQFKTRMIQAHNEHLMAYNPASEATAKRVLTYFPSKLRNVISSAAHRRIEHLVWASDGEQKYSGIFMTTDEVFKFAAQALDLELSQKGTIQAYARPLSENRGIPFESVFYYSQNLIAIVSNVVRMHS